MVSIERIQAVSAVFGCPSEMAQELLENEALDGRQLRQVDDFIARKKTTKYREIIDKERKLRAERAELGLITHQYGLTVSQWTVLGVVHDGGKEGVTITRIARELGTSLAYATTSVNALVYKGIVDKRGNSNDIRKRFVTYKAGDLIAKIEKAVAT